MVALVLVGHSLELLHGLRAMLAQAAPGLLVGVAGGTDAGALGTSAPLILDAVRSVLAASPEGAVVLLDLGARRSPSSWRSKNSSRPSAPSSG